MKLWGLPTTKHVSVLLKNAWRTCCSFTHSAHFRPSHTKMAKQIASLTGKTKTCFVVGRPQSFIEKLHRKIIHKSSSNLQNYSFFSYFVREFHKCVCQLWFSKVKLICRQIYVLLVGASFLSAVKHNFI